MTIPDTTENAVDTTAQEPPTTSEADLLVFALERSRAQFAWKCGGLDAAALSKPYPPSVMTLGGLVKHLALVEDRCTAYGLTGEPLGPQWDGADFEADPDWEWRTATDDSPEVLYTLWQKAVERSRAALARALTDGDLDYPASAARSGQPPILRRILIDMHQEYARHVGHADLLREAIDGLTGANPPQP
jgi:Protein of unknown function (DUF664)